MAKAPGIDWKDFHKLSKIEQSMLEKLGIKVRNKPTKNYKNGKVFNKYLKPYTVCITKECTLCGCESYQWFRMYCDPLNPGECLRSRKLNPMNWDRLLGTYRHESHGICDFCEEVIMDWDKEDIVKELIRIKRCYMGALARR